MKSLSAALLVSLFACSTPTTTPTPTKSESTPTEKVKAPAEVRQAKARAWEHESSDVQVNPRIHFGKFDNGFRYAWMANSEPNKRCYIRLHVDAGSLGETDTELGIAHFLEHMAFNGSTHFPANTLVEWFQKHGMAFGADTNASTSFSETVYKLDLPNSDEKTLGEGFEYFRDVADGLTLDEKEVHDEKGVIDGEERERNSAAARVGKKGLQYEFSGTRVATRLPIGTKEVRDQFSSKSVRAFYERWYRPENMTLVVVGDLKELNPETLIKKYFSDIKVPASKLEKEPALGKPSMEHKVFTIYEKEIPTVSISIDRLKPWEDDPADVAHMTKDMGRTFANRMLNLRFSELAKKENSPFIGANVGGAGGLRVFEGVGLNINCTPEKWKEALTFCEQELRRALEYGFQESELKEVRANYLRSLTETLDREKTESSLTFMADILAAVENRHVPTDATTDLKIFKPKAEALTVEDCHKAFVKAWNEGTLVVSLTGNLDLGKDGNDILMKTYEESQKVKVEPNKKIEIQAFAYPSSPDKKGTIKSRRHIDDLDFDQIEFENGVRVNIKKTDFKEKQIIILGRLGEGSLTLAPEDFYLRQPAAVAFSGGGLGAHTEEDLRRLLAGKQILFTLGVQDDFFSIGGNTTGEDLLLECELIAAYMTDPGWRDARLKQLQKNVVKEYENLEHRVDAADIKKFTPALYSNDPRFTLPPLEKILSIKMDQVKQWLSPYLANAPLEISFVGDLDVDKTVDAIARTLGTLPQRRAPEKYEDRRQVPVLKSGINKTETVDTSIQKSFVVTVFPATDGIDIARRRTLGFLNQILNDRVRIEIREKLGASYSPRAMARLSGIYPGDGMFRIQAMSDPDKAASLAEACLKVADDLGTNGVTQEELDRLRGPLMTNLRDQQRTNAHWIGVLSESQSKPETLDDERKLMDHYKNMKAEDLSAFAKQYLKKDRASVLVANPDKKEETAKPAEAPAKPQ